MLNNIYNIYGMHRISGNIGYNIWYIHQRSIICLYFDYETGYINSNEINKQYRTTEKHNGTNHHLINQTHVNVYIHIYID